VAPSAFRLIRGGWCGRFPPRLHHRDAVFDAKKVSDDDRKLTDVIFELGESLQIRSPEEDAALERFSAEFRRAHELVQLATVEQSTGAQERLPPMCNLRFPKKRPMSAPRITVAMIAAPCASMEALDIIRRMAVRSGDDQIASVLNRLGYSTGKAKRWNQIRVATARRNHSIPGQKRAVPDPERISLSEAARLCGVSHHSIERLVETGLLKREQAAPRAPWAIHRADLDKEPVRSIIERLLRTGKLILQGDRAEGQPTLFNETEGDDNARHHE